MNKCRQVASHKTKEIWEDLIQTDTGGDAVDKISVISRSINDVDQGANKQCYSADQNLYFVYGTQFLITLNL